MTELAAAAADLPPIKQTDRQQYKIYPNPTTGNFTLEQIGEKEYNNVKVEVYGMRGERVMASTMTGEKRHQFSLSDAPFGIYFVKIAAGDVIETTKLIKQ